MRLSLQSRCTHCNSLCHQGKCANPLCQRDIPVLTARLSVLVEDGSGQAVVVMTQTDQVRQVLALTLAEWSALERCVHSAGDVIVSQYWDQADTATEKFLQALCDSTATKRVWSLTLRCDSSHASTVGLHSLGLQDFVERRVRLGEGSVETHTLPYLQFHCLRLAPPDYRSLATAFLRRQPSSLHSAVS